MAPKAQPYWMFVMSMQRKAEREGTPFNQDDCPALWEAMSADSRQPYLEAAKRKSETRHPSTSSDSELRPHISLSSEKDNDVMAQAVLPQAEVFDMIRSYFSNSDEEAKRKQVMMAASNLLMPYEAGRKCLPMEIALVTYSISEGIISKYHRFTDPGPVPLGCVYRSRMHSQETHAIPPCEFHLAIGRDDRSAAFHTMLDQIMCHMVDVGFSYKGKTHFLLFTRSDQIDQVRGSFLHYVMESGHKVFEKILEEGRLVVTDVAYLIRVFSCLFGGPKLRDECCSIAESVMFDYKSSCEFHTRIDNNFCVLSICCRCCFLLSDHLLPLAGIDPIPGHHLPIAETVGFRSSIPYWGGSDSILSTSTDMDSTNGSSSSSTPTTPTRSSGHRSSASGHSSECRSGTFDDVFFQKDC